MDKQSARQKRKRQARERIAKRQQTRERFKHSIKQVASHTPTVRIPEGAPDLVKQGASIARDGLWYALRQTSLLKIVGGIGAVVFALGVLTILLSGNIGPNVWSLGVALGGMSVADAEEALLESWYTDTEIDIMLGGERYDSITPEQLGLTIDAAKIAADAKALGLSGFPFGQEVVPSINADYSAAQDYMLSIVDDVIIPPYEAGYAWEDDQLVGVPGRASLELDIAMSVESILQNPRGVVERGRFDLITFATPPAMMDPTPYLDDAYAFVTSEFTLVGYDPFRNEFNNWQTTQAEMARWLAAGTNGLVLRENAFERFLDAINDRLEDPETPRFINPSTAIASVQAALDGNVPEAYLRINYLPRSYTIASGDSGFAIGRKTGLPFREIQQVNPGVDWNQLIIGQEINLPSWDVVMPEDPVPQKRIVVDLDRLWLVAYEDEQVVFNWPISSGRSNAPTYPGIYQILEKNEKAYGSSFNLCNDAGDCGQWVMDYFMGIYEVAPNLMNGFHGAVLLPNGAYLDGGSAQVRSTYGCVMSDNAQAEALYNWAEVGTVVEMVSSEFAPRSSIGHNAVEFITQEAALRHSYASAIQPAQRIGAEYLTRMLANSNL